VAFGERGGSLWGELLGTSLQDVLDQPWFGLELLIALACLPKVAQHPLQQKFLGVDAAGPSGALAIPDVFVVIGAEDPVQLTHVANLWPPGVSAALPLRVCDHAHDLFPDDVFRGEDLDDVAHRLGHLVDAVGALDDGGLAEHGLRLRKGLAVTVVEGAHDLASQLQVRGLVLADRHVAGLVDGDVCRLQHRIVQERQVDVVWLAAALFLERRCALDPAGGRDRGQQPHQLKVFGAIRLPEQHRALGVEPQRQQAQRHLVGAAADELGIVGRGQRVIVHDAVDGLVAILHGDVVSERAQVVADMWQAGGLDAGEDASATGGRVGGGRCRSSICHRAQRSSPASRVARFEELRATLGDDWGSRAPR